MTSETVDLIPSDSDVSIKIHEGLLSAVSPALCAAIQQGWKESTSKVYGFSKSDDGFDDVTKATLICFARWAYQGDYTTETVGVESYVEELVISQPETIPEPDLIYLNPCCPCCVKRSMCKCKREKQSMGYSFGRVPDDLWDSTPLEQEQRPLLDIVVEADNITLSDACIPHELQVGEPGIGEIYVSHPLLVHIHIYVFASIYCIDTLKEASRRNIVSYLQKVRNARARDGYTDGIFDLLAYAFSHLHNSDPLLAWLGSYSSWNLKDLKKDFKRLEDLVGNDDGKFARFLVKHVGPSMNDPFNNA